MTKIDYMYKYIYTWSMYIKYVTQYVTHPSQWKTSLRFCGAETPFPSIILLYPSITSRFPGGNSSLIFEFSNIKFADHSWLKAPRCLLMSFLDFKYFSCFWVWNHCFLILFFFSKKCNQNTMISGEKRWKILKVQKLR